MEKVSLWKPGLQRGVMDDHNSFKGIPPVPGARGVESTSGFCSLIECLLSELDQCVL